LNLAYHGTFAVLAVALLTIGAVMDVFIALVPAIRDIALT
jgi:hypothetical protein